MEGRRIYVKHPSYYSNSLKHSGTKGMHWGERLYQYKDGSLTPLGRIHYGIGQARVKRAEEQAKNNEERERRKYQNSDGTLKLRGKLHYKTTDKYALLTDDDLKQQSSRLQLQKNLEDLKKQTSASYRLKSKLESAAEDITVAGFKKAVEKIVNNFVDKSVSKLLGTDEDGAKKAREVVEKLANMSTKEIKALNARNKEEKEAYERLTGEKVPKDYKYSDLPDAEKSGINKPENNPKDNPSSKSSEKKQDSSKQKSEKQKTSDSKKEESQKLSDSEISKIKAEVRKGDSVEEVAEKTGHSTATVEKYANIKSPVMKEYDGKPVARVHRVDLNVNKKKPLMKELEDDDKKKKKG